MAKSPEEMEASMVANLEEKTGRPLEAWLKMVARSGLAKHGDIVKMLKSEHGVTHGYANLIAHHALRGGEGAPPGADLIEAQYGGAKAALRPIYEKLVAQVSKFGPDVEIAPKKTYVSLRRHKQFALVQASSKARVDVGVQLVGETPTARLQASGSFNQMVSHRVLLTSAAEVDAELVGWLRQAYDRA